MGANCSKCKIEISQKVFDYSKKNYGKILCRDCQPKNNAKKEFNKKEVSGLSKKESKYKESMIKGRIAETLVEELFLSLGYNVFRYGMENTIPGVMKLLKEASGKVAEDIRRMPDFVIQDEKNGNLYFIEVKFRKDGEFDKHDKSIQDYPYKNAYFIIVSKKHIKCITYEELKEGKKSKFLGSRKEFELDKKTIIDFCDFAKKFFECV